MKTYYVELTDDLHLLEEPWSEVSQLLRRRMETEDKAKVVASVWEAKFVLIVAALAVLPLLIRKKRLNSSFTFKSTQTKQIMRQEFEQILPPKQTR